MDFSFNAEQEAIRDLAQSVFADHCDDERIRRLAESGTVFDKALWGQLAQTGLIGLAAPEALGGSELGMLELAAVLEAQGRHLAPVPLWTSQLTGLAIGAFGRSDVLKDAARAIHAGQASATLWTEAGFHPPVRATRRGNGWQLDGFVSALLWGRAADWALLPVEADGETRHALLKLDDPALEWTDGELTNQMPVADLGLSGIALPDDQLLSAEMGANWLEERMALCIASLQLGVTGEALKRAASYLGEREQFGRPIGSFQGVAMRMADSYIEIELLRSMQLRLAWLFDNGLDASDAARVAKFQACEAGHIAGHTAIHYHGGVGADLTHPIHRFYLWSRTLEMTGGGGEEQLKAIGGELPAFIGEDLS